jgi:putative SOS response-associated peptidase YedK
LWPEDGLKAKKPYAIAMEDGNPFGIGGIRENWEDLTSGGWIRTRSTILCLPLAGDNSTPAALCGRRR